MGCCCKKQVEPKRNKTCCVCNPFDQDGFLLTAQIASILGALISWVWWPLFVISAPIVTVLNIAWCCKMRKAGLWAAAILSFLNFVGGLGVGIFMVTKCWHSIFVVMLNADDDDTGHYYHDYYYDSQGNYVQGAAHYYPKTCSNWYDHPNAWIVIAFVDAALFFLVFACTSYFVLYKYDEKASNWTREQCEADADEVVVPVVEMGVVPSSPPQATATIMDEKNMDQA